MGEVLRPMQAVDTSTAHSQTRHDAQYSSSEAAACNREETIRSRCYIATSGESHYFSSTTLLMSVPTP